MQYLTRTVNSAPSKLALACREAIARFESRTGLGERSGISDSLPNPESWAHVQQRCRETQNNACVEQDVDVGSAWFRLVRKRKNVLSLSASRAKSSKYGVQDRASFELGRDDICEVNQPRTSLRGGVRPTWYCYLVGGVYGEPRIQGKVLAHRGGFHQPRGPRRIDSYWRGWLVECWFEAALERGWCACGQDNTLKISLRGHATSWKNIWMAGRMQKENCGYLEAR